MDIFKYVKTKSFFYAAILVMACLAACAPKNPRLATVFLDRGIVYIQQGQYTHALRELLDANKQNPDDPVIHYYLGIAYYGKKLNPEAISAFKEAISLKSDYSEAHNYLGMVYSEMGSWDDAIAEYKKAVANILYETPATAFNNMGYAYYRKGDYKAALSSYDEAFAKDQNTLLSPLIEKNRGVVYFAQGRVRDALGYLKKSADAAPNFPETHYWLARCYVELKDLKAAAAEFHAILRLAPDSEFGAKAREGLEAIAESR